MPTYRITSDDPEKMRRIAMRVLGRHSTFTSVTVDGDDLLVEAASPPDLPPALTVAEE